MENQSFPQPTVRLLFPAGMDLSERQPTQFAVNLGGQLERVAMLAARTARSMLPYDELAKEVQSAPVGRVASFLKGVVGEEWSLDVVEYLPLIFHVENLPSWACVELFRHRLILRDWSPEQRSKRAIFGHRIPVHNPFDPTDPDPQERKRWQVMDDAIDVAQAAMERLKELGATPQDIRNIAPEGSYANLTLAGNLRGMAHLYQMRGGLQDGFDGKAAPVLWKMVHQMASLTERVYPAAWAAMQAHRGAAE